jgi:predicted Zn-dependent protease
VPSDADAAAAAAERALALWPKGGLAYLAALEPLRPEVHERLGTRLYQARKFGAAAQAFEKALALSPENAYLRRMAGFACSKAGDPARAVALLRPLFLDDPLEERVRTTFIAACRRTGELATLCAAIDEALARHPHARMLHGIRKRYVPAPAEGAGSEGAPNADLSTRRDDP